MPGDHRDGILLLPDIIFNLPVQVMHIDDDSGDALVDQPADGDINNGLSGNRKQGLGNMICVRPEPGAVTGRQDKGFHGLCVHIKEYGDGIFYSDL